MPDTLEPDDGDIFTEMMTGAFGEHEPLPDDFFNLYSELSTKELVEKFEDVRSQLLATGEMVEPKSPEAVDLSGVYHGLLLEKRKRGLR